MAAAAITSNFSPFKTGKISPQEKLKIYEKAVADLQTFRVDLEQASMGKYPFFYSGLGNIRTHYEWLIGKIKRKIATGASPFAGHLQLEGIREAASFLLEKIKCYERHSQSMTNALCYLSNLGLSCHEIKLKEIWSWCNAQYLKWIKIRSNSIAFQKKHILQQVCTPQMVVRSIEAPAGSEKQGVLACIYDLNGIDPFSPFLKREHIIQNQARYDANAKGIIIRHATGVAEIASRFDPKMHFCGLIPHHFQLKYSTFPSFPPSIRVLNVSMNFDQDSTIPSKIINGFKPYDITIVKSLCNSSLDCSLDILTAHDINRFTSSEFASRVLLVGALSPDGVTPAWYTNIPGQRFEHYAVFAPGAHTVSDERGGPCIQTGTSLAAPVVTALVGIISSTYPMLRQEEVVHAIKWGAEPIVQMPTGPHVLPSQASLKYIKPDLVEVSRRIWGWGRVNWPGALRIAHQTAAGKMLITVLSNIKELNGSGCENGCAYREGPVQEVSENIQMRTASIVSAARSAPEKSMEIERIPTAPSHDLEIIRK